jgi:hypothetical protein
MGLEELGYFLIGLGLVVLGYGLYEIFSHAVNPAKGD